MAHLKPIIFSTAPRFWKCGLLLKETRKSLRGIKQAEIYDHCKRKGLHEEDNLQHVLQDSIPQEMIHVALPPEPEEPNKPVKVPECAICVIHPVTCDCDPEEYHPSQKNALKISKK